MFIKYLKEWNLKKIQMSHVIVLSDSDEFDSSVKNSIDLTKDYQSDSKSDDFEFPEVHFDYIPDTNEPLDDPLPVPKDSACFLDIIEKNNEICTSKLPRKRSFTHDMSDSSESELYAGNICISQQTQVVKVPVRKDKDKLKEERLRKKQNADKEKVLKKLEAQKLKDISPKECMKFITVILDEHVKEYTFHSAILTLLSSANISYNFISHSIANSITWERQVNDSEIYENCIIHTKIKKQTEKHIIIIWYWNEVVEKLVANSFCTTITSIRTLLPDYNMTLIIFGLKGYFKYHENRKKLKRKRVLGDKTQSKSENFTTYKESLEISKKLLDSSLAEIEVISKCNNRLIENPEDLALAVYQYTKAIAEIPYKLKTNHCDSNDKEYNWYVAGDNRDTVCVDKNGNGLKRLWQQQLCQFNSSSLEIAEAICAVYKSPVQLLEAYMNCTPAEGSKLLKDIPIRRAAGPLRSMRRIGPELSKKIYIMFTSETGDTLLGNDE